MSDVPAVNKLIVLYTLRHADFPLTGTHLDECLVGNNFLSYFDLRASLHDLADSGLIRAESRGTVSYYTIDPSGLEILEQLQSEIPDSFLEGIRSYMQENRMRMKDESSVFADYERLPSGEYAVNCRAMENGTALISLSVSVPDEVQARLVCLRWIAKCQPVYETIMKELLS